MKEEFLHYLWKYSLYDAGELFDDNHNSIVVLNPGEHNRDSGPDFFNSRIYIDGTEWAGNVEIHTQSSHFNLHGHHTDPAYNNVVLHVVAKKDKEVYNERGEELLTVELKFDPALYEEYISLINNPSVIACQKDIKKLDSFFIRSWLGALLIERLQERSESILKIFSETGNDWEETFYRMLVRYFGFRVNTEPFEMLATALPFKIIRKHTDNRFQIEAMLFGSAGMLEEGLFKEALADAYYIDLIKEYRILSAKYSLQPGHGWVWKFSRLRPANFPTIRISQLSGMLATAGGLFSRVLETTGLNDLRELFNVSASDYWDDHYIFGKKARKYMKKTGIQSTDIFLINGVLPVMFVYGKARGIISVCDRAVSFLEEMGPEKNLITREWEISGIKAESAFYSQSLIHLRNNYCKKRRCIHCRIGSKLISMGKKLMDQKELLLEP